MRIIHGMQSLGEGPAPACRNGTRWLISSFLTECPAALAIETLYFMLCPALLAISTHLIAGATQSHHSFGRKGKGNHKLVLYFAMEHWCFENIINQTSHAKPICSVELKSLYIICFFDIKYHRQFLNISLHTIDYWNFRKIFLYLSPLNNMRKKCIECPCVNIHLFLQSSA